MAVLSYSENPELAGELVTAARAIAANLRTTASAVEFDRPNPRLPAENVLLLKAERDLEGDADSTAAALAGLARAKGFAALLVGETRFGTVVAAKVAARLRVGALGKGKDLRIEGDRLAITRDVYGGRFVATVGARMPCVAMVQAGAYAFAEGSSGPVETISVKRAEERVAVIETRKEKAAEAGIKTASRIVAAGRGFAKKEDLSLARDLAGAMGAALGSSRPLSSDLGWLGEEHHIGLTGAYVHPNLYVAVGISGQLQHVTGIKDSKVIVAINSDAQAPIFQFVDYGIVGDLYQVLPALTKVLKAGGG